MLVCVNDKELLFIYSRNMCTFTIVLFIWSSYVTVTEDTSKSLSGRHGNRVDILVVSCIM